MNKESKERLKAYKKIVELKNQDNKIVFFLHGIKWNKKLRLLLKNVLNKFLIHKKPISVYNVDTKRTVLLFNKRSYNKIFIGYNTNYIGVIPLYRELTSRNAPSKYYKNSKKMNLLAYDKDVLNKYNAVWNKIKDLLKNNSIVSNI